MRVILIGYRGSGKSVVGRALAPRLGLDFVDADVEIESQAGQTIAGIFAEEGEAGFRVRERTVMVELCGRDNLVIAAGGGAVLDTDTRADWVRSDSPVVWLTASAEELQSRIASDATTDARRPALTEGSVLEEISTVLAERELVYRNCATLTIETGQLTIHNVVERIVSALADDRKENRS
ncbi:MAG: shikimate kinase [Planctomycetaceae bacterium]